MPLAWIEDRKILFCSNRCGECDKKEQYGCVPVMVVRGNLRERLRDLIPFAQALENGLWLLLEMTFLRERGSIMEMGAQTEGGGLLDATPAIIEEKGGRLNVERETGVSPTSDYEARYKEGFYKGYQAGYYRALEKMRDLMHQAINQIPQIIQINVDPKQIMQLQSEILKERSEEQDRDGEGRRFEIEQGGKRGSG